jgi:hypothetical protein
VVVWIVVGVVVASLVFLALATVPVLRRLPALRGAMLRLQERATQAQGMQARGEDLQRRAEELAGSATRMQAGIAGIQARLPGRGDSGRG